MTALVYTLGVVLFFLGVVASIALHEVGHMVPAKKFGVKVTQYFVGFGRTLWSTKRGDTEYGIKMFPLGGFIRMIGMLPPEKRDANGRVRGFTGGVLGKLIADARAVEYERVTPVPSEVAPTCASATGLPARSVTWPVRTSFPICPCA